jgi:VIT family
MFMHSIRVLDPTERTAEVLFGLIMVLTFTGSLSVAEAGRAEIRTMLIGALGCNLAWGVIDGVLYLMGALAERARNLETYRAVRQAADPGEARRLIAEALPPVLASVLVAEELERARQRLQGLSEPSEHARLSLSDWRGACGVFLLVFLSTFPVAVPFLVMQTTAAAMRVSNGVAVVMLFAAGIAYGRLVGRSPLAFGISMVALGSALVALTIALGG